MEIMAILKLVPMILTVVEAIKRFIPSKQRAIVNPIVALVTGCVAAYTAGGTPELLNLVLEGLAAGAIAMGTYSAPKAIGKKLGVK
jgi:hypothetical protein